MVMNILRSKKVTRNVLLALLVLIIPAFVLWGVGGLSKQTGIVGRIGTRNITLENFAKSQRGIRIQIFFTYYQNYETLRKILQNRPLVNYMAWERLVFLDAARGQKIKATDKDVLSFISQHPLFQRQGVFDKEVYNYILMNNLSVQPRQFEELVRENMQIRQFRQDLLKDIDVSDEEVLDFFKESNDKAELSYLFLDKDLFADEARVSPETAKKYYEENKEFFFEPEKVELEYIEVPYEDVAQRNSVERKIMAVYPELTGSPEKFMETSAKHGLSYDKTGPFSRDEMIPGITFSKELHDIVFNLEDGEITSPVFSSPEKGTAYIFRKIGDIPRKPMSFEDARESIVSLLSDKKRLLLAEEKAGEILEEINGSDMTLEKSAKAMGQKIKTTGAISSNEYIENIGPAKEIVLLALETEPGKMLPPATIKKGVILSRVDKILPADESDFEKNKAALRNTLLTRKQMDALDKWFAENESRIKLKKSLNEL